MVMAQIYAITGQYDKAIDKLEFTLSIEAWSTPEYIKADPIYAPLLEIPRFQDILRRYEAKRRT